MQIMSKLNSKASSQIGKPPGSLIFVGKKKIEKSRISVLSYNEKTFEEKELKNIEECFKLKNPSGVTWINIDGLHETDIIEKIGKHYGIHPLALEDILNTNQRPKVEIFEDHIFIIMKMITFDEKNCKVLSEQVSIILGKNFVISFQERPGDIFDPLRERIRKGKGRIRKMSPDYLAYAILDMVTDYYFMILEKIGEKIEEFEEDLISNPKPDALKNIYEIKKQVLFLRKSIWPMREAVNKLEGSQSSLIKKTTIPYLRGLYDHIIQVIDTIEINRELLAGMLELYLSSVSNKMNEVMKVLTMIATIFIPLTFITGIYGTNFEYLPELKWHFGYFGMWAFMLATVGLMFFYFRRKKWDDY